MIVTSLRSGTADDQMLLGLRRHAGGLERNHGKVMDLS